ncbi:unnamed protein product [Ixodes persulcatus]
MAVDAWVQTDKSKSYRVDSTVPPLKRFPPKPLPKEPESAKIFRELLERTAGKAKRLNNRLNTPQPTHYGAAKAEVPNRNRKQQTKRRPDCVEPPQVSPLRGHQSMTKFRGLFGFDQSYGRLASRSTERNDFHQSMQRNRGPTDESIRSSEIQDFYRYTSPERLRSPAPSPGPAENYRDFSLPRRHHQCKRDVAPPNVMLMNQFEDFEMPSPRYVLSTPGFAKHKGDVQRFRRFGSTIGWVTDEYSKHKQHGPSYYDSP